MTSRAQMPLVREKKSHSENLTFSALRCEQMYSEKRASDDETKKNQEHRNIASLNLQLRSYKKPLPRNRIFYRNTVFSIYFKMRVKKFHVAKPLDFLLHVLFGCDQNLDSNLNSKFMKTFEQIFNKRAPQYKLGEKIGAQ